MNKPLKVGILSFAHQHGVGYASVLSKRADVELRVADENPERGKRWAEHFGVPYVESYADLLDWGPDAAIVCSENAGHRALVELTASAGAHVLCEKPLATTLADGRAMIETCEKAGVNLMTAFPVRFAAPMAALEAGIRTGRLGHVHGVEGVNFGTMPGRSNPWFVDPSLAGGGAVMDHTVHVADLLRWMLGCEATEVYAQVNSLLYPDLPVETAGLVAVTFANGTVATIDCSWSRPYSYPTWGTVRLDVIGEQGLASVDAFKQTISAYSDGAGRDGDRTAKWLPWGANADAGMLDEFIASIREGRPARPDGWDGYRATEIAMGAYESVRAGQPVKLPLDV
jgi:predicted dehydrogenase